MIHINYYQLLYQLYYFIIKLFLYKYIPFSYHNQFLVKIIIVILLLMMKNHFIIGNY